MTGELLQVQFGGREGWSDGEASIEVLAQRVIRECRRRAGLTPEQFAWLLNARSARQPGLTAEAILAYEAGQALPGVDVYYLMLTLAGVPVRRLLTSWLAGSELRPFAPPSTASAPR